MEAFDAAIACGTRCALATVVSVEGSAYRRAGARMLVREDGSTTGTISAGCLDRDVVEHARRVLRAGTPKLVRFDTRSAGEDMAWGLGIGCNGIVHVLVEPVGPASCGMGALRLAASRNPDAAAIRIATVFQAGAGVELGARVVLDGDGLLSEGIPLDLAGRLAEELVSSDRDGTRTCKWAGRRWLPSSRRWRHRCRW